MNQLVQARGQSKMSPRARELAAKNAHRRMAGRESSGVGLGATSVVGLTLGSILLLPFTGICGAVVGGLMTDGSSAAMVVGAVVMVLLQIPFTIQRYLRKEEEKAAKRRYATEKYEIHQADLRRARGEDLGELLYAVVSVKRRRRARMKAERPPNRFCLWGSMLGYISRRGVGPCPDAHGSGSYSGC